MGFRRLSRRERHRVRVERANEQVRPAGLPEPLSLSRRQANPIQVLGGASRGPDLNVVDNNERSS